MTGQLALAFDVKVENSEPHWSKFRTQEQENRWQQVLVGVRAQKDALLAIAHELSYETEKLYDLTPGRYVEVCGEYWRRNPRPVLLQLGEETPARSPSKPRPYIEWSLERKHKDRCRKLMARAAKRYSLPVGDRWDYLQGELVSNPHYYGVCVLPNSGVDSCKLNFQDFDPIKAAAIAKEKALRREEAGDIAIAIPVSIPNPEKVLISMEDVKTLEVAQCL